MEVSISKSCCVRLTVRVAVSSGSSVGADLQSHLPATIQGRWEKALKSTNTKGYQHDSYCMPPLDTTLQVGMCGRQAGCVRVQRNARGSGVLNLEDKSSAMRGRQQLLLSVWPEKASRQLTVCKGTCASWLSCNLPGAAV